MIRIMDNGSKEHLKNILSEEEQKTGNKRTEENKCYKRIFIDKPIDEHDTEFKPASQL